MLGMQFFLEIGLNSSLSLFFSELLNRQCQLSEKEAKLHAANSL